MSSFCPDGYVRVVDAIGMVARYWFPEQIVSIQAAAAGEIASKDQLNQKGNELTGVEELARALVRPSISNGLRHRIEEVARETEHRSRNFLYRGDLTAYYFGGLLDHSRQIVVREFWATTEADEVLLSGIYWPFGKPRAWPEQRPNRPLLFLESELAALLSSKTKPLLPDGVPQSTSGPDGETGGIEKTMVESGAGAHRDVASAPDRGAAEAHGPSQQGRAKSMPARQRARRVIAELYPEGVPDQSAEPNARLCHRVGGKLKEDGFLGVSDDTILRAAGRRK